MAILEVQSGTSYYALNAMPTGAMSSFGGYDWSKVTGLTGVTGTYAGTAAGGQCSLSLCFCGVALLSACAGGVSAGRLPVHHRASLANGGTIDLRRGLKGSAFVKWTAGY